MTRATCHAPIDTGALDDYCMCPKGQMLRIGFRGEGCPVHRKVRYSTIA
jgi:hypothetical protein